MIEEGLLERRGKWSANGTLSPVGHLLTLHSPAAPAVSVYVCACVRVCVSIYQILIHVCFSQSVYPSLILLSPQLSIFSLNFFQHSHFDSLWFLENSHFNCSISLSFSQRANSYRNLSVCNTNFSELIRSCQAWLKQSTLDHYTRGGNKTHCN